ncbi:hypothetical protein [Cetobacterium sp.]|uniref:hypothetical protein n=1 Tax=Cetobacterium sp. TaxID=2071632 RepID=UPI003EE7C131
MYKVDLIENETILKSKELNDYEKAIERVNELMGDLVGDRKIIVYSKKGVKWIKFGEWKLQD